MSAWKLLAREFLTFLREHRGVSEGTIANYWPHLRRWIQWLNRRNIRGPAALRAQHIDAYLAEQPLPRSISSRQAMAGTLRMFLRFLRLGGSLQRDFSELIILPRTYALAHVPRFLEPEQVRRMLDQIDGSTAVGKRDRAMVALMLGLGLRVGQIGLLCLPHVDLAGGRLRVPGVKGHESRWMPLTAFERDPLVAYLNVRPSGGRHDALFLRLVGSRPLEPISKDQITQRVRGYLRAAGIERGACHLLRHTFAQRLVDGGAPLCIVQKLLGHHWSSSTRIYTKVAREMLREVAQNDSLHF